MVASVGFESGSIGHFRVPSHSQTEAKCKTFVVKMLCYIHENKKTFSYPWLRTWPRFESEAWRNSEMVYWAFWVTTHLPLPSVNWSDPFCLHVTASDLVLSLPGNGVTPLIAPRNVTVTNKTSTALLINWTHVDHSELLGYRVRYNRNITCDSAGNYTNCSFSIFLCKNITTIWLEDLEIYTDYWIEVVAFKNGTFSKNISTSVARTDEGGKWDGFALLSSTILGQS